MHVVISFVGAPVKGLGRNSDCLQCSAAFARAGAVAVAPKPKPLVIAFSKLLMGILASVRTVSLMLADATTAEKFVVF